MEKTAVLGLTGALNFLNHGVLPQAAFAASYLQQKIGLLVVSDLMLASSVLKEVKALKPAIAYIRPLKLYLQPRYLAFSDTSQCGAISLGGRSLKVFAALLSCEISTVTRPSVPHGVWLRT